ncbi:hypothetical protein Ahy_B05g078217 isoform B [Arachis hypogaea]|uniref:Uncharacterized protein n=1 Tax=Arachis hypogaea TaxID=3818 RepID=A0A444Z6M2_ARAHY|nr:hypothetical protein Ahy_B05g078217 isoform B [Arachis hypogaea]
MSKMSLSEKQRNTKRDGALDTKVAELVLEARTIKSEGFWIRVKRLRVSDVVKNKIGLSTTSSDAQGFKMEASKQILKWTKHHRMSLRIKEFRTLKIMNFGCYDYVF